MDPIATLRSCLQLAKEIYDLKQKIDADDAACNMFFARVQSLNAPLEKLNNQLDNLGSKKVSLDQLNECLSAIMAIAKSRVKPKKSLFGFVKKATASYTGSFKEGLSDMNVQLDRCISTLQLCVSVDTDESVNSKLDEIAAALQTQILGSTVEPQFCRDPHPDDSDDERSVLGKGAFGVTHRMKNTVDTSLYAVKVIKVKDAEKAGINKDMMIREATTLRDLNHKYLVRYYTSYFSKEGKLFNVVMELVSGGSLDDKIKDQSVTVPMIRQWLVQLADVLSYLHHDMGLLHRDIKPDNILLTASGSIKLIDLGMACVYESSLSKMSKAGTQTYSSYEKAHGLSYDGRDDVWGAGCVFGELLTKSRLVDRGGSLYMYTNAEVNNRRLALIQECTSIDNEMGSLLGQMLNTDVSERITSQILLLDLTRPTTVASSQLSTPAVCASQEPVVPDVVTDSVPDAPSQSSTPIASTPQDPVVPDVVTDSVPVDTPPDEISSSTTQSEVLRSTSYSCLATITGHSGVVYALVMNANGSRLYSASHDKSIKVWDTGSHQCTSTLTGHTGIVFSLVCDEKRNRLYSSSKDRSIKVWDMASNACVATLSGHTGIVYSIVYEASRDRLYSGSIDKAIKVWDMSSHDCIETLTGHISRVLSLYCDATSDRLFSGSADKSIKVWNIANNTFVATLTGHLDWVSAFVCDVGRNRLYSGSHDKSIKVWDMSNYTCVATLTGHSGTVNSLLYDVSGDRLYSGSEDKSIKVWDMASHTCLSTLLGHEGSVSSIVFDVNTGILYSGSDDNSIKVWKA